MRLTRPACVTLALVTCAGLAPPDRERRSRVQDTTVRARMDDWSASLGVGCDHCHVPERWADRSKPTFDFAERMSRMVAGLNAGVLKAQGGVTCWTCHRGQPRPARLPVAAWTAVQERHRADFVAAPDRALTMSVYAASLGVGCDHCHVAGTWADGSKPAHAMTGTMTHIFEEIPSYFDPAVRTPRTQCFMCHQGTTTPERRRSTSRSAAPLR